MTKNVAADAKSARPDQLRAKHFKALSLIMQGLTLQEVAQELGVTRQTISDWKNRHPLFKAKLEELYAEAESELRFSLPIRAMQMLTQLHLLASEGPYDVRFQAARYFLDRFMPKDTSADTAAGGLSEADALLLRVMQQRRQAVSESHVDKKGGLP